jgi:hypothetical protein
MRHGRLKLISCSLVNREYAVINVLIFYAIYKLYVLSIYCKKKRLRRSNFMRKVDRLRLIFIDPNVPAFGPLHH